MSTRSGEDVLGRQKYGEGIVDRLDIPFIGRKKAPTHSAVSGVPEVEYKNRKAYNPLRGVLADEDDLTKMYVFQFNPETVRDNKMNSYSESSYTGLPYSNNLWANGGLRTVDFTLFMDATAGSNTRAFYKDVQYGNEGHDSLARIKPRGTLDDVELLQSFQYPRNKANASSPSLPVPQFSSGGMVNENQFVPPPTVIFCYGGFYLRCQVMDLYIEHALFNKDLYPVRSKVDVMLNIIESSQVRINPEIQNKAKIKTI